MASTIATRPESNALTPTRLVLKRKASAETSLARISSNTKIPMLASRLAMATPLLTRSLTVQRQQAPMLRQKTAVAPMLMLQVGKSQEGACL